MSAISKMSAGIVLSKLKTAQESLDFKATQLFADAKILHKILKEHF